MGNDFVIRPAIDRDGKFIELKAHQHDTQIKRPIKQKVTSILHGVEPKMEETFEQFSLKNYKFKVATLIGYRVAEVDVFISDIFAHETGENRNKVIERFVINGAPWLFSYAWRSEEFKDR